MIVGTCGFGSTGSSAVTDYLKEFNLYQVMDNIEFTWVYATDGLIDLDQHINHPHSRTGESIYAIYRYRKLCETKANSLVKIGVSKEVFMESVEEFIDSIVTTSWWWNSPKQDSNLVKKIRKLLVRMLIQKWEIRNGRHWEGFP